MNTLRYGTKGQGGLVSDVTGVDEFYGGTHYKYLVVVDVLSLVDGRVKESLFGPIEPVEVPTLKKRAQVPSVDSVRSSDVTTDVETVTTLKKHVQVPFVGSV